MANKINPDIDKVDKMYMKKKEFKTNKLTEQEVELVDRMLEKLCERYTNSTAGVELMFEYIEKVLEKRRQLI